MVTISNEKLTVKIAKRGAEIQSIKGCDGTEYMWDGNPDVWPKHAPVLFPICGRLKEGKYTLDGKDYQMQLHGFANYQYFDVESKSETAVTLLLKENEETLKIYPYTFEFRAVFELDGDSLRVTYKVKNTTDRIMYFSMGAHEGYACPEGIEDYKVIFDEKSDLRASIIDGILVTDDYVTIKKDAGELDLLYDYFATEALVFRDVKPNQIILTNGKREITVEYKDFKNLLLWTKPDARYLCIEPWTGIPDVAGSSFELSEKADITSIEGGAQHSAVHTMTFRRIG